MVERIISRHKGLHRNIYLPQNIIIYDNIVDFIIFLLGLSFVNQILEVFLGFDENMDIYGTLFSVAIYICLQVNHKIQERMKVSPYKVTEQFSGLYCVDNLEKLGLRASNGLLSREKEVEYLYSAVESVLNQNHGKQGICLIGKSGCGKSTILYFLKKSCSPKIEVFDYSKKYDSIEWNLQNDVAWEWEKKIQDNDRRYLFVFDQFEQFFYKTDEKQKEIEEVIRKLTVKNVAVIFSIREEFLSRFIKRFDLNNLNNREENRTHNYGIIENRELISLMKESVSENSFFIFGLDEEEEKIVDSQYYEHNVISMEGQCINAFGTSGKDIYLKFSHCPLIQQQIIFNVLQNEKSQTGYLRFEEKNEDYILRRYYDVQLCSTGNFFIASRVMYLLCLGDFYHISFETDDIMRALCIPDIESKKEEFNQVMECLQDIQLVKCARYNSREVKEIAHDYIAKSYESYAKAEMPVDVRAALDEYTTEYIKGTSINKKIDIFRKKSGKQGVAIWMFFLSIAASLIGCICEYKAGNNISLIVELLSIASIIYVYTFYRHITCFCPDRKFNHAITFFYVISMICGSLTMVLYEYWLACLGVGNFFIGLSCVVIGLDKRISSLGKKMYLSYGSKTMLMGILLVVLDIYSKSINNIDYATLLKIIAMGTLLIYAYYAHINEEFIYSHLEGMFSNQ